MPSNSKSACIRCKGDLLENGYGRTTVAGRRVLAHRAAYESNFGPIAAGMFIDHRCSNRWCVNPNHLRAVTPKQNAEHRAGPAVSSKTGARGVFFRPDRPRPYRVQVGHRGRYYSGGSFASLREAEAAAQALRDKLFTHHNPAA